MVPLAVREWSQKSRNRPNSALKFVSASFDIFSTSVQISDTRGSQLPSASGTKGTGSIYKDGSRGRSLDLGLLGASTGLGVAGSLKTWRRVDVSARPRPGAKSADELASADMARRARMAAFRGLWRLLICVLTPVKVRARATVQHGGPHPANKFESAVDFCSSALL